MRSIYFTGLFVALFFNRASYSQVDTYIDERENIRSFNDSYIKPNVDNNADMRMTGSATILGLITLPFVAQNGINGSAVLINEAGELGAGIPTIQGDFAVCSGNIITKEINPCSPTTTTSFGGSINLPSATTANNGSLQIAGERFLHNYGTNNTFVGSNTGNLTTSGSSNVAVGKTALQKNTTGSNNAAVGSSSLALVRIGVTGQHTGIGSDSLSNLITGTGNIALGYNAGNSLKLGSNNIHIGNRGVGFEDNIIRLGTTVTHTGCFMAGISGQATSSVLSSQAVSISSDGKLGTTLSSRRYKDDIKDIQKRSNDLMKLRPVAFVYKSDPTKTLQYGLIAEEVTQVYPELTVLDQDGQPLSVRYDEIAILLLNEYQQQIKKMNSYDKQLVECRDALNSILARLAKVEKTSPTKDIDILRDYLDENPAAQEVLSLVL